MQKVLLFSHSGFSDTDANGITMKNLLSAWSAEEKAEFYCDVQTPDFVAACNHFRVTDVQMMKAFWGKKARHIFCAEQKPGNPAAEVNGRKGAVRKIPAWLKKYKYNFALKWLREYLWFLSPWGHRSLRQWIDEVNPDVIVYMVGESLFMDKLVLRSCEKLGKPLVLYNGEAFRIIDLKKRHGLERAYYKKIQKLYGKLNEKAELVIYNCRMLMEDYQARYPVNAKAIVAYNSAECVCPSYEIREQLPKIVYFGNLGVGRSDSLLKVADALQQISSELVLDIYGNATEENWQKFQAHPAVHYHGFVDAENLRLIMADADILIHAESFDQTVIPKLRYAFSTKIAQCLCAGRCFVSFAPAETASSRYLVDVDGVVLVSDEQALLDNLRELVTNSQLRMENAAKVKAAGMKNHQMLITSRRIREEIEAIVP